MSTDRTVTTIDDVSFDDRGLVSAIAQDRESGKVLMLGYMTKATLAETLESGKMTYWSRSRNERWQKGETSGDLQILHEAFYDCDADALLFVVDQQGDGACHTKNFSCFFRSLPRDLPTG